MACRGQRPEQTDLCRCISDFTARQRNRALRCTFSHVFAEFVCPSISSRFHAESCSSIEPYSRQGRKHCTFENSNLYRLCSKCTDLNRTIWNAIQKLTRHFIIQGTDTWLEIHTWRSRLSGQQAKISALVLKCVNLCACAD